MLRGGPPKDLLRFRLDMASKLRVDPLCGAVCATGYKEDSTRVSRRAYKRTRENPSARYGASRLALVVSLRVRAKKKPPTPVALLPTIERHRSRGQCADSVSHWISSAREVGSSVRVEEETLSQRPVNAPFAPVFHHIDVFRSMVDVMPDSLVATLWGKNLNR